MSRQNGITLIELVIVVALGSIALVAAASYSVPMMAKETMRSAVYDVQTYLQLARIESVGRNHDCRFVINSGSRQMWVIDTMGTGTPSDDQVLYGQTLPDTVEFARPDSGAPVTLGSVAGKVFQTTFRSDGTATVGAGDVFLMGGDRYGRVSVFAAGGIQVSKWNGTGWETGS